MLNYPNDYDTPAFPAGKTVAFTRTVSIWISVIFFLIVCTCGFILLSRHLKTNYPFLISVDPFTNEWTVLAYPNKNSHETIEQYQIFQEKLVRDFVTSWFTISENQSINEQTWANCSINKSDEESVDKCAAPEQYAPENKKCALYCNSDSALFEQFTEKILPEYKARFSMGPENWKVGKMDMHPGIVTETSSKWQVYLNVISNINGLFKVLAFVDVERDLQSHPATMGYYIKDLNSYRMTQ